MLCDMDTDGGGWTVSTGLALRHRTVRTQVPRPTENEMCGFSVPLYLRGSPSFPEDREPAVLAGDLCGKAYVKGRTR